MMEICKTIAATKVHKYRAGIPFNSGTLEVPHLLMSALLWCCGNFQASDVVFHKFPCLLSIQAWLGPWAGVLGRWNHMPCKIYRTISYPCISRPVLSTRQRSLEFPCTQEQIIANFGNIMCSSYYCCRSNFWIERTWWLMCDGVLTQVSTYWWSQPHRSKLLNFFDPLEDNHQHASNIRKSIKRIKTQSHKHGFATTRLSFARRHRSWSMVLRRVRRLQGSWKRMKLCQVAIQDLINIIVYKKSYIEWRKMAHVYLHHYKFGYPIIS